MTWFKVDDKLHDHRKARAAGCAAMGMWTLGGSWSADNLMDGFVPASIAARWDHRSRTLAEALVTAGFWYPDERDGEQGWSFHDWEKYQPTRAKVLAEREAAAERQRKRRSRSDSRGTSAVTHTASHTTPTRPDPLPTGERVGCDDPDCDQGWVFVNDKDTVACAVCRPGYVVRPIRSVAS